jgi:hypothetical protein
MDGMSDAVKLTLPNGLVAEVSWEQFQQLVSVNAQPSTPAPNVAGAAPNVASPPKQGRTALKERTRQFLRALRTSTSGLSATDLASMLSLPGGFRGVSGEVLSARADLLRATLSPEEYFYQGPENRWKCNPAAVDNLLSD